MNINKNAAILSLPAGDIEGQIHRRSEGHKDKIPNVRRVQVPCRAYKRLFRGMGGYTWKDFSKMNQGAI